MSPRPLIFIFILLMITFTSIQNPISVSYGDLTKIPSLESEIIRYEETENKSPHFIHKRQLREREKDSEQQPDLKRNTGNKNSVDSVRYKRFDIEGEESLQKEQFYKPAFDETKQEKNPLNSVWMDKGGKEDHEIADDLRRTAKIYAYNIRQKRRMAGVTDEALHPQGGPAEVMEQWGQRTKDQPVRERHETSYEVHPIQNANTVKRMEGEDPEMQQAAEIKHLSPETLDTIRKINPLTIGDQVSRMIHNRKCNSRNQFNSRSVFDNSPRTLESEDHVADPSYTALQDNDDAPKQQRVYDKPEPPKIVHKPCPSNDYGFSVIILAGDPIKVGDSGVQTGLEGKEDKSTKMNQRGRAGEQRWNTGNGKNWDHPFANPPRKEWRIPKDPDTNVQFPVYDQDLTSVPDPFHGLLVNDYWRDPVYKDTYSPNTYSMGTFQEFPPHKLEVRDVKNRAGAKNQAVNDQSKDRPSKTSDNSTSVDSSDVNSDATQTPEVEPFGDLVINTNNMTCLSYGLAGNKNGSPVQ